MDWTFLVGLLALVTLLTFVVLALISKRKVEKRMDDPNAPKSTLAADKSAHGKPAEV